ncbi:MAG: PilZ domain-containing protein [Deltaproteobacteria bacterium]|nr:PilZ domain-containing protein [Deltaproteobacteria bacterium]
MRRVLAASNSDVMRLLGSRACRRLELDCHVVTSGREALERAHYLRPCLAILDVDMPELDGYSVCERLKADPDLEPMPVMLVASGPPTVAQIRRLRGAGADDLMVVPVDQAEFLAHLGVLLGLPHRRSPRLQVELVAWVRSGVQVWAGRVDDLSMHGVRVRLERPLPSVESVRVRLVPPRDATDLVLDARVVWRGSGDHVAGLEFTSVTPAQRNWLEVAVRWEAVEEDGILRVYLQGAFNEWTDFSGLERLAAPRLDFDAADVRYVNSHGARRWTAALERVDRVDRYTFSRCSPPFVMQAAQVGNFLGRGEVLSFSAPYHCQDCDHDETRLLQTAAVAPALAAHEPPRFRCQECGGSLILDDIPERYLAFVSHP